MLYKFSFAFLDRYEINNEESYHDYYSDVEISYAASKAHPKAAIQLRNREMVDRADLVLCCIERKSGGAYQTVLYAKKQNITDKEYHLQMASKGAAEFPEIREINTSEPIMLKDHIRLSASEICGGYTFWTDDVSEIEEAISELQDINKTLNERHTLIREENRTNKQKAHLLEANRLYNRMQLETAPQLKKMQDLVSTLYKEDKPENEKELLAELTLIGAYFKRRNNLLFVSETQDTIRMAELGYCFRESVSALELQGVTGSCLVEAQGNISLSESIQLYDAFQSVLQKTFSCINSIAVFLRTAESGFEMCISLHLTTEMTFQFDSDFRIEQEEENDFLLTYFVARGDGDGK